MQNFLRIVLISGPEFNFFQEFLEVGRENIRFLSRCIKILKIFGIQNFLGA